jgi:hypothetical protein
MKNGTLRQFLLVAAVSSAIGTLASCGGNDGDDNQASNPPANTPTGTTPTTAATVKLLSSKAEYVTGGDALIDIALPTEIAAGATVSVTLNGTDVSSQFKSDPSQTGHLVGVVKGLKDGANTLVASVNGTASTLTLTNYPSTSPMLSGPYLTPFICQTQDFTLPDGTKLGAATDINCSAPTKVNYLYRSTAGGALKPLPSTTTLPADVARTTTTAGTSVPFVVRVETGTMNRGIYQNAILHDPTVDGSPTPLTPPKGWNKRLIAVHGSGCTGGWYIQGAALGVSTYTGDNLTRLGEGYAVFNNTLNHPTNSCNAVLAGETALMGKEHFIETFGVPAYTVSTGGSGGAYTSLQTADAFPGLFDGVFINSTFPDALSIAMAGSDDRLLSNYYLNGNPANFSEGQMVAVTGHKSARAWYDLAMQSGRTDPVPGRVDPIPPSPLPVVGGARYSSAVWPAAVPTALRYNPTSNPTGARPTVFDVARNVYGTDKTTGFALRPFDNVGVQYGLKALNAGTITPAQFLDLNEKVGGYDQDANYVATRTSGDPSAIKRVYQSGLNLNGNGGLSAIPVFDISSLFDENDFYHYQVFHFAARERIAQANGGDSRNHVMWRGGAPILAALGAGGTPEELAINNASATQGWTTFIQWMEAYKADTSTASQREKVISKKPATAVDGCFTKSTTPQFIAEVQTLSSQPNSQCNTLWPSYTLPRIEAGGPVASDKLKCTLKPVDSKDYGITFTAPELSRLNAIFPSGVCDYSKPGVNQTGTITYPSFGPSPVNLVFDITKQ